MFKKIYIEITNICNLKCYFCSKSNRVLKEMTTKEFEEILKKINMHKLIKLITFGFNSKSTITISSVNEDKIIVFIQRDIEMLDGEILESQEKKIVAPNPKKIYNSLVVFIIKELHNL